MAGAVRVGHDDVQVGLVERQVIVAAVPQDYIGFLLGLAQDRLVVHAGINHDPAVDVRLVFFPLLDGALVRIEIGVGREALHPLRHQVAVGHRMADGDDLLAHLLEQVRHVAGGLRLAAARAHRAHRDHRFAGRHHGVPGADQTEVGARSDHRRGLGHHVLIVDVRIGEDDLIHPEIADQVRELAFGMDWDSLRIVRPGQLGGVAAAIDVRDLCRGECDDLVTGVAPEEGVEVVEIAPCGAHDQHTCLSHDLLLGG